MRQNICAKKAISMTFLCNISITLKTFAGFYWQQSLNSNTKNFLQYSKTVTTEVIRTQKLRFSSCFKRIKFEIIVLTFTTSGLT